jgi:hypothetical protein
MKAILVCVNYLNPYLWRSVCCLLQKYENVYLSAWIWESLKLNPLISSYFLPVKRSHCLRHLLRINSWRVWNTAYRNKLTIICTDWIVKLSVGQDY